MLPHMRQLLHVSEYFYQTTRRRPWLGKCVPNSTAAGFFLPDYAAAEAHRGEGFESWARRGEWASATIHSLTTRLHGGGRGNPAVSFASYSTTSHAILLQRIERGLWRYFYKTVRARGTHATKLYGDFLLSLYNQTPMTTTTTTAAAAF